MDDQAHQVEQRLLQASVQLRMGADDEPGWREAVDSEEGGWRRHRAGRARQVEEAPACDADDRPVAPHGSGVRKDFAPLLRTSGRVREGIRESVVQADPSRHGAYRTLSRQAGAEGAADLAGPRPEGHAQTDLS